jgi:hypothetical protein
MIMRIAYGTYAVISFLILCRFISLVIFHPENRKFNILWRQFLFIFIWPIAIFSRNGRGNLKNAIPFINDGKKKYL